MALSRSNTPLKLSCPNKAVASFEADSDKVKPRHLRTSWQEISNRFCEPQECFAAYLALESAEVIAGVKPANLISIPNRTYSCGINLYRIWKECGNEVAQTAQLETYELIDRGTSALVLLYRPTVLAEVMTLPAVRVILRRAGYSESADTMSLIKEVSRRIANGVFPHEIGILLGYPLKDVAGFMGLAQIPFTCQGPWKIYGAPEASLKLAETFRWCRRRMAEGLAASSSPFECLGTHAKSIFLSPH